MVSIQLLLLKSKQQHNRLAFSILKSCFQPQVISEKEILSIYVFKVTYKFTFTLASANPLLSLFVP